MGCMSRQATPIKLTAEDKRTLEQWVRSTKTEQRLVLRAHIILSAAKGEDTKVIAENLRVRPATVSKWRTRFAKNGMAGLQDAPRPGARKVYDDTTDSRILATLDRKPPTGHAGWSGELLAKTLGDVSKHQVWRVLRRHGIQLQRRRSWCISTDPEFAPKAADIVGLYLEPPDNAVVLCVEEKPQIQALERAQGWLRLPNGKALTGFNHGYKRHGTTTLFAAFDIASGQVMTQCKARHRHQEFLNFLRHIDSNVPEDLEIHFFPSPWG